MKDKVYLAGPLFTKYEIEVRKKEHIIFKEAFPEIETFMLFVNKKTPHALLFF